MFFSRIAQEITLLIINNKHDKIMTEWGASVTCKIIYLLNLQYPSNEQYFVKMTGIKTIES